MHKNYFAVIPGDVMFDKVLTPGSKLMYGQISGLCNDKGFCWATNKYFADQNGVTERTIQNHLEVLESRGYIVMHLENNNNKRKIYITERGVKILDKIRGENNFTPKGDNPGKNFHPGGEKIFTPNNNNKVNIPPRSKNDLGGRAPTRGTRIDPDFAISDEIKKWRDWKYPGISDKQLEDEKDGFVDKYVSMAGPRSLMVDWNAAFKTWIRNDISWGKLVPRTTVKSNNGVKSVTEECDMCKNHREYPKDVKPCPFHDAKSVKGWLEANRKEKLIGEEK